MHQESINKWKLRHIHTLDHHLPITGQIAILKLKCVFPIFSWKQYLIGQKKVEQKWQKFVMVKNFVFCPTNFVSNQEKIWEKWQNFGSTTKNLYKENSYSTNFFPTADDFRKSAAANK